MSTVSYQTALALKNTGLPQPMPATGQFWYYPVNGKTTLVQVGGWHNPKLIRFFTEHGLGEYEPFAILFNGIFAPDLEYIAALLPPGWLLEMWDGRHSCRFDNDETQIRTQADNFAHAAALLWLELNKTTSAPNIIEADAKQIK